MLRSSKKTNAKKDRKDEKWKDKDLAIWNSVLSSK